MKESLDPPPGGGASLLPSPAIIRAADNENLFSPLPRGACETNQPFLHPLHPFLSPFVRISPPRTPYPLLPSSSFDFHHHDSSNARIIEHFEAFLLFIPLGERTLEILVSDNRDRILFAIIGGDEPRLPYRVPSTAKFPWKSSLETPRELYLYLFDEVDIPSPPLLSRVYIHL